MLSSPEKARELTNACEQCRAAHAQLLSASPNRRQTVLTSRSLTTKATDPSPLLRIQNSGYCYAGWAREHGMMTAVVEASLPTAAMMHILLLFFFLTQWQQEQVLSCSSSLPMVSKNPPFIHGVKNSKETKVHPLLRLSKNAVCYRKVMTSDYCPWPSSPAKYHHGHYIYFMKSLSDQHYTFHWFCCSSDHIQCSSFT